MQPIRRLNKVTEIVGTAFGLKRNLKTFKGSAECDNALQRKHVRVIETVVT